MKWEVGILQRIEKGFENEGGEEQNTASSGDNDYLNCLSGHRQKARFSLMGSGLMLWATPKRAHQDTS